MGKEPKPSDLEISVRDYGRGQYKWMLTIGPSAPYDSGVVTGTRDEAILAAREKRLYWISKGKLPNDRQTP